jgi:hypothetical protein
MTWRPVPDGLPVITPGSPVRDLWAPRRPGIPGRIGAKAMTGLRRARVGTVAELTGMTALEVDDIPGIGAAGVTEVRRVLVLTRAGVRRPVALRFARESWPSGEIAPGVTLTVAGDGRG